MRVSGVSRRHLTFTLARAAHETLQPVISLSNVTKRGIPMPTACSERTPHGSSSASSPHPHNYLPFLFSLPGVVTSPEDVQVLSSQGAGSPRGKQHNSWDVISGAGSHHTSSRQAGDHLGA